jgi:[CysO sulfur-carrier protein]-S-L-cysteine hydrolase
MLNHVLCCLPEEACGLVASFDHITQAVYPITNELHSLDRFRMAPIEQLKALLDIDKQAWELAAIFHSHPDGQREPSEIDINEFNYPGVIYLIWYKSDDQWLCDGYEITKSGYLPIELTYIEDV